MILDRRSILLGLGALPFADKAIAEEASPFSVAPLRIAGGEICLGVTVKDVAVEAVFDTGASNCVIDEGLAQKLGVKAVKQAKVQFIYANGALDVAEPVDVSIGHVMLKLQPYIGKLRASGLRHDMLLGVDAATQIIVAMDPTKPTALIMPRGRYRIPPAHKVVLKEDNQSLTLDLSLDGQTVTALIDTGNEGPISVHSDWAKQTGFLNGKRTSQWISGDLSGIRPVTQTSANLVKFGGFDFHNVPVTVRDDQLKYQATIGAHLFAHLYTIWNLGDLALWLPERQSNVDTPFWRDRSGLAYLPDGDALKVIFIAPGSPAAKASWKIGDRITKIDGVPYRTLPDDLAWKADPTRQTVSLTLDTGEVRVLTLSDYY